MRSELVVVSWWANCLALRCLHCLVAATEKRQIHFVQVGKSSEQRERFRRLVPAETNELEYDEELAGEHSKVLAHLVNGALRDSLGVWFVDHDLFFTSGTEEWLSRLDARLGDSRVCLARKHPSGPAITSPLLWISPRRLPSSIPSFDPVPFRASRASRRPDLYLARASPRMPTQDTLVAVELHLRAQGLAQTFDEAELPEHQHLGGLYALALDRAQELPQEWLRASVVRHRDFLESCPSTWQRAEDPALVRRLRELAALTAARC